MREKISQLLVLLTSFLILGLSAFFALSQNQYSLKTALLDTKKIEQGQAVFREQGCILCHSVEGKGNRRNPLDRVGSRMGKESLEEWVIAGDSVQDKMSNRAFIKKQRYKKLPPYDLEVLLEYMQSL